MHNILIIGVGQIGKAHLQSFLNVKKNYNIYLLDNKNIKIEKNNKIFVINKIPDNVRFSLAIISTNSNSRFSYFKKLFSLKIKWVVLEKFLFTNKNQYILANKIFSKNNINTLVNTWGKIILKKSKINFKKINNFNIDIKLKNGSLLSNISHFLELFFCLNKSDLSKLDLINYKLKKSKRRGFHEIFGKIKIFNKNNNSMTISSNNTKNNNINIKIKTFKKKYEIIIKQNGECYSKINNKMLSKFKFPYSSIYMEKMYASDLKNKNKLKYFNNYTNIQKLEYDFLKMIRKKIKNIKIT